MITCFCDANGIRYQTDYPLNEHTTFRIGGTADLAVFPENEQQVSALVRFLNTEKIPRFVLGRGSNVLADDAGYRGVLICTDRMNGLVREGNRIFAGAGCSLASVSNLAQRGGLAGIEFLHGIPGSVGGGVFMNAGAYGGAVADRLESVRWVDLATGEICQSKTEELSMSYRHTFFTDHPAVICRAVFRCEPGDPEKILRIIQELDGRRREKQPLEYPSAGSTFKRPEGHFAGQLIEQAGLKGFRVGGAEVSRKHAGFVINVDHATGEDVRRLIKEVSDRVFTDSGVRLETEVLFLDAE